MGSGPTEDGKCPSQDLTHGALILGASPVSWGGHQPSLFSGASVPFLSWEMKLLPPVLDATLTPGLA